MARSEPRLWIITSLAFLTEVVTHTHRPSVSEPAAPSATARQQPEPPGPLTQAEWLWLLGILSPGAPSMGTSQYSASAQFVSFPGALSWLGVQGMLQMW